MSGICKGREKWGSIETFRIIFIKLYLWGRSKSILCFTGIKHNET
jgi:hypothetical protein